MSYKAKILKSNSNNLVVANKVKRSSQSKEVSKMSEWHEDI